MNGFFIALSLLAAIAQSTAATFSSASDSASALGLAVACVSGSNVGGGGGRGAIGGSYAFDSAFGDIVSLHQGHPLGNAFAAGSAVVRAAAPIIASSVGPAFASVVAGRPSYPAIGTNLPPTVAYVDAHIERISRLSVVPYADVVIGLARGGAYAGRGGNADPFVGRVLGKAIWIVQHVTFGFPNEILLQIFSHSIGDFHQSAPARQAYVRTLYAIIGTCRHWAHFVDCNRCLWASYDLNPFRLTSSVDLWLSKLYGVPIDLRLDFDDLFSLYHPVSTAAAPRLSVRNTILRAAPVLGSCARLSINAEETFSYPFLLELLCAASGRLLVSLSLTRVTLAFMEGFLPPPTLAPNLFFKTGVPLLRFLRLRNATPGWDDHKFYPRLEVLVVHDLHALICFTAIQLYLILLSCSSLMYLSLRDVPCDALPPRPHAFFSCVYLLELDLHLTGTLGIPDVLSRCEMPSLRKLSLTLDSEFDLRCLLACSFLEQVAVLSLEAPSFTREVMTELWSRLPSVEDLDIGRAGFTAFDALYSLDGPFDAQHFCPKLRCLTVVDVCPSYARRFLERRFAAGFILVQLTMFRAADFSERVESDVDWLSNVLGADHFKIDPDCELFVAPQWIEH
ncbi:hypothetical protein C8F04DRAFT_1198092 [Mycena alexandri]|uniref:Uncharacterized protein n=1 Tax=Mycena alexandri TaxID=1745969 RepID=A0AAD6WNB6_9AGAR|nr:hypothetical protein C8F04DRAFT_1198092 [Mycena alexandri]